MVMKCRMWIVVTHIRRRLLLLCSMWWTSLVILILTSLFGSPRYSWLQKLCRMHVLCFITFTWLRLNKKDVSIVTIFWLYHFSFFTAEICICLFCKIFKHEYIFTLLWSISSNSFEFYRIFLHIRKKWHFSPSESGARLIWLGLKIRGTQMSELYRQQSVKAWLGQLQ